MIESPNLNYFSAMTQDDIATNHIRKHLRTSADESLLIHLRVQATQPLDNLIKLKIVMLLNIGQYLRCKWVKL